MKIGSKILLATGISLAVFGGYMLVYRNRKPELSVENIDWDNKTGVIRFGNTENQLDLKGGKSFGAGKTYNSKLYSGSVESEGDKAIIKLFNKGQLYQTTVVDFKGKLIYEK